MELEFEVIHDKLGKKFKSNSEKLNDIINRDCAPFLEECGNNPVYRGLNDIENISEKINLNFLIYKLRTRKNRLPLHTPEWLHKKLDEYLLINTGNAFRSNSIFCTGDYNDASNYGEVFRVFPIGKFSYSWSKFIVDPTFILYLAIECGEILSENNIYHREMILKDMLDHCINKFSNKQFKSVNDFIYSAAVSGLNQINLEFWKQFITYFLKNNTRLWEVNVDLKNAARGEVDFPEIMIKCDSYYAIPAFKTHLDIK